MGFMYYLLSPFSWLLNFFYSISGNYGIAIILFAVVVRIILFPFTLKGKRSMIQMNLLSGKMQNLQKQYGKDKERYNLEVQRLYEREKVNPMSGCLWNMVPMFILIPLFYIIREPLTYLMGLTPDQIFLLAEAVDWQTVALEVGWTTEKAINSAIESASTAAQISSGFANNGYNQLYLSSLINETTLPAIHAALGEGTGVYAMNFSLFGLNLAAIPTWEIWVDHSWNNIGLVLMVILSVVMMFVSMRISTKTNQASTGNTNASMDSTNKTMMYTMPLMYLWFGFIMPGVMCAYFIAGSVLSMVQEIIAGKMLKKDYEKARIEAAERERIEKEEEKERKRLAAEQRARQMEEDKKNRGKKKAQKKEDGEETTIRKSDSREGMRQYARGRNYDPNRFGGVTEYHEPFAHLNKKEEAAPEETEETTTTTEETAAIETTATDSAAVEEVTAVEAAPVAESVEGGTEYEEVEVEENDFVKNEEEGES